MEFSHHFFDNEVFVRSLSNALREDGIFVARVGEEASLDRAGAHRTSRRSEFAFMEHLKQQGFERIDEYAEAHGDLRGVQNYKIAFKSVRTFERWHLNQANVDLEIHGRSIKTMNRVDEPLFRFFDGATMMTYQYPSRLAEEIFCRDDPVPELCKLGHGLDPERRNVNISFLEVKLSPIPNAGRGVFVKEAVSEGSYIAIDESCHDVVVMPSTVYLIQQFSSAPEANRWKMFDAYLYGYGFQSDYFGVPSFSVDGSITTFFNHGCSGSNNVAPYEPFFVNEMTADPKKMPAELDNCAFETAIYNPFVRRNHLYFQHSDDTTSRDIKAGEEILDSYLGYFTDDTWERGILDLRAQCLAQGIGSVRAYDASNE